MIIFTSEFSFSLKKHLQPQWCEIYLCLYLTNVFSWPGGQDSYAWSFLNAAAKGCFVKHLTFIQKSQLLVMLMLHLLLYCYILISSNCADPPHCLKSSCSLYSHTILATSAVNENDCHYQLIWRLVGFTWCFQMFGFVQPTVQKPKDVQFIMTYWLMKYLYGLMLLLYFMNTSL